MFSTPPARFWSISGRNGAARASQYGIRGIPTLMLFKDGKVAATKVGALPKNKLKEWIESVI
jgi:thioredoxin-like negative regulator of GroEL